MPPEVNHGGGCVVIFPQRLPRAAFRCCCGLETAPEQAMRQTTLDSSFDWAGRAAWLRRQVEWLLPYAALAVIAAIAFGMPSPQSF